MMNRIPVMNSQNLQNISNISNINFDNHKNNNLERSTSKGKNNKKLSLIYPNQPQNS
jgi:hypothetical protein